MQKCLTHRHKVNSIKWSRTVKTRSKLDMVEGQRKKHWEQFSFKVTEKKNAIFRTIFARHSVFKTAYKLVSSRPKMKKIKQCKNRNPKAPPPTTSNKNRKTINNSRLVCLLPPHRCLCPIPVPSYINRKKVTKKHKKVMSDFAIARLSVMQLGPFLLFRQGRGGRQLVLRRCLKSICP